MTIHFLVIILELKFDMAEGMVIQTDLVYIEIKK